MTTMNIPPARIDGPSAWIGADLAADPSRWLYRLSRADIDDLENAARHCLERMGASDGSGARDDGHGGGPRAAGGPPGLDGLRREDFPLGRFGRHVEALSARLLSGVGVEVLRGLPLERWSDELAATVFVGLGVHLGLPRPQNAAGDRLGHVRDAGRDSRDPTARLYQTAERQTFHTDSADVVGLLCLRAAKSGGDSLLVSAETLYNRFAERHPALLPALFEPIATDRRGEVPPGADPWFSIPVFSWHAGKLTVMYQRQYIDSAARFPDAPRPSATQIAALDAFDTLANDPDLHVRMRLEPGDMQFVHNHSQLHDRTAFVDWPDEARRRHLLRLWLSLDGDRELPPCFAERYGSTEIGRRGGVTAS